MKYSDFTPAGRTALINRLYIEQENWNRNSWWRVVETTIAKQLCVWHEAFQTFKMAVTANQEIEPAFKEWSGQELNDSIDLGKISVPQLSFLEDYRWAVRELKISQQPSIVERITEARNKFYRENAKLPLYLYLGKRQQKEFLYWAVNNLSLIGPERDYYLGRIMCDNVNGIKFMDMTCTASRSEDELTVGR